MNFYICKNCGNTVIKIKDENNKLQCCKEEMTELKAGQIEAATEKHIPIVQIEAEQIIVKVEEIEHPMEEKHYIEWILLEMNDGFIMKKLKPGMEPKIIFETKEKPIAVYAYCNLHGLWKNTL